MRGLLKIITVFGIIHAFYSYVSELHVILEALHGSSVAVFKP